MANGRSEIGSGFVARAMTRPEIDERYLSHPITRSIIFFVGTLPRSILELSCDVESLA